MVNIRKFPYLGFVRFDLVNKEFDAGFNRYFNDHIQELADKPGYSTSWRTREVRGHETNSGRDYFSKGLMEQEYQQIYAITKPEVFNSFPSNPPPPVNEREPWRRDMGNWGRVFYHVHAHVEKDPREGRYWARCDYHFTGSAKATARFKADCERHLKRVLALPGIHRAWFLEHAPTPAQIAADPTGQFMLLYEIDAPANHYDPSLDEDRLPLRAGQQFAGRHFARLLLKCEPQA
jgi:hypothetical protein